MKFPFLASFIILILVVTHAVRRNGRIRDNRDQDFWAREAASNNVRKKPLDDLPYVELSLDPLPCDRLPKDPVRAETVTDCIQTLRQLATQKIVCFSGITNTDLKLTYGTANITVLSAYDQNFTLLVTTLQKWAENMEAEGDHSAARQILEYAVSVGSDNGKSYYLLASLYEKENEGEAISSLIRIASELNSPSGKTISRVLRERYPSA